MSEEHHELVIIRRRGGHEDEHHGGAWKIAFADFMTAMMTFFLVLWIINATDKNTKSVIARYFNPVRLENPAKGQKGVHNETGAADANAKGDDPHAPTSASDRKDPKNAGSHAETSGAHDKASTPKGEGQKSKSMPSEPGEPEDAAHPRPKLSEGALLADPYGSLDHIAGPPPAPGTRDLLAASRSPELNGFRDPFEMQAAEDQESLVADNAVRDPPLAPPPPKDAKQAEASAPKPEPAAGEAAAAAPSPSTLHSSAAAGGRSPSVAALQLLKELKTKIGAFARSQGPMIEVRATKEGLLISLTDQLNFSMFPIGSAEPQPQLVRVMDVIAQSLSTRPGRIVLRGHTDGRLYRSQQYDNWRLSEARAQMAYYMLTRANLAEKRIERVEGYADHRLRNSADPYAAENRRIEILLQETER
jgi:chemotaxis protein MotB